MDPVEEEEKIENLAPATSNSTASTSVGICLSSRFAVVVGSS
uniref:Uncharacterized protein n=1 Tax=Solanum lycopersicum TaxID=4081 RepID=A0A3Q7ENG1_SOLLC